MRPPPCASRRSGVSKSVLVVVVVLVATLRVDLAKAQICTAHAQCLNDEGTTRANYCDALNQCYPCAWEAAINGNPYWSSCDATNDGNGDAIVSSTPLSPPDLMLLA